jgi:hypothetical protein
MEALCPADRRGVSDDQRGAALSVAGRGSGWLCARYPGAEPSEQARREEVLPLKSPGQAQRFLSAYGPIAQHFRPRRHLLSASAYRQEMSHRFESWAEITGAERAA